MRRELGIGGSGKLVRNGSAAKEFSKANPRRCNRLGAAAAVALPLVCAGSAYATVLSIPSPSFATVASTTTFPTATLGTDGYDLFQMNAASITTGTGATDMLSQPAYVQSITPTAGLNKFTGESGGATYGHMTIGGSAYNTGIYYESNLASGATVGPLITITLSSTAIIPAEFQLGILGDNTNQTGNDTNYTVYDNGTIGPSAETTDVHPGATTNNFYFLDITNAAQGDVLTIYGSHYTTGVANVAIGGVTFDTLVAGTPEPTSLGLLGLGGVGLLLRRRRKPSLCQGIAQPPARNR